jgi:gamma-glutamyl hercynylcysteine S-oxide synthase
MIRSGMVLFLLLVLSIGAWAAYGVRISDLGRRPTPPNPIKVWGKVVSVSPLKISDGRAEIELSGTSANINDFLIVTGNWNGSILTVAGPASLDVEMVYVSAGSFQMGNSGAGNDAIYGNPNESPVHSVTMSGYWIGKYEVTRGQYKKFMNAGGYNEPSYWSADGWNWKINNSRTAPYGWGALQDWGSGGFTQTDNHPVVGVSYYEAEAFCNWAGGHLPTEAQWEKAARWNASTNHSNIYPWGDTWNGDYCNCWDDHNSAGGGYAKNQTAPVGSYSSWASPYGCQDMAGNVGEWCRDWYRVNYYSQTPANDPQGPPNGDYDCRVVRGGTWADSSQSCRCAYRNYYSPSDSWLNLGFRLAR